MVGSCVDALDCDVVTGIPEVTIIVCVVLFRSYVDCVVVSFVDGDSVVELSESDG